MRFFFVLSGFLITGILLDARESARRGSVSYATALARFYGRRAVRILPLYFLIVGVTWLLGMHATRQAIGSLVTFTYNLHLMQQGWWDEHMAHFWSLSVEQQFYLVWPWPILFMPRRFLWPTAVAMLGVGELTRYWYVANQDAGLGMWVSPLASADALGLGAVIALALRSVRTAAAVLERWPIGIATVIGLVGSWASSWWQPPLAPFVGFGTELLHDGFQLVGFAGLIAGAALGFHGAAGTILSFRPLTYLGQISYGLYLYHPLMVPLAGTLLRSVNAPGAALPTGIVLALALSLGTTMASWHLFERPLNQLRRCF